jgi:predicted DNA-binding transcriptional regulator AlpA
MVDVQMIRRPPPDGPQSARKENAMADDLLDQRQAAARLGLPSARTLEAWRSRGYGPPFLRLSPRLVRYRASDLEQWLAARVVGAHRRDDETTESRGRRRGR